ncbi:hypothetical protein ACFL43_03395 [Thermodesulfobacteriota bacterium]
MNGNPTHPPTSFIGMLRSISKTRSSTKYNPIPVFHQSLNFKKLPMAQLYLILF